MRLRGEVLLIDVAAPVTHQHAGPRRPSDIRGSISAAGVDDDNLVGPGRGLDGGGDVGRFVERDDRDREFGTGGILRR